MQVRPRFGKFFVAAKRHQPHPSRARLTRVRQVRHDGASTRKKILWRTCIYLIVFLYLRVVWRVFPLVLYPPRLVTKRKQRNNQAFNAEIITAK